MTPTDKSCLTCHWRHGRRDCGIAKYLAKREEGAETDPLSEFYCCRYEKWEPKVEISRAQFWEAVEQAKLLPLPDGDPTISGFMQRVAAGLGLGEGGGT